MFEFWFTAILVSAMTLVLIFEILDADIAVFSALLLLILGGVINVDEAFCGFSNQGMLTVGFLFIVAAALQKTGVLNTMGQKLLGEQGGLSRKLARFLPPVSAISAFFNNTPIVAMLIPVVRFWCKKNEVSVSKLLIPLSYATILGGTCTLIGTSTQPCRPRSHAGKRHARHGLFRNIQSGNSSGCDRSAHHLVHRSSPASRTQGAHDSTGGTDSGVCRGDAGGGGVSACRQLHSGGQAYGTSRACSCFRSSGIGMVKSSVGPYEIIRTGDRLFFTGLPETILELQKTPGLSLLKDATFDLKNYDFRRYALL